jgi:hypothetical protein
MKTTKIYTIKELRSQIKEILNNTGNIWQNMTISQKKEWLKSIEATEQQANILKYEI